MADRFYGTVMLGGTLTQDQCTKCLELLDPCLEDGYSLGDDGSAHFQECTSEDFVDLVEYCKANSIALAIQWDAKWEYAGRIDYFIEGNYQEFQCNNSGEITVTVADLKRHSNETPYMTIEQYIDAMDIPDFPDFLVIEECQYCGGQCTDDHGCDAHISNGESALP